MKILDGKKIAAKKLLTLKEVIAKRGKEPTLAVILIGNDKASHLYVKLKEKAAKEVGIELRKYLFAEDAVQEEIITCIDFLNKDLDTNGIIVQMPLPKHLDANAVVAAIDPEKDVDGFHKESIAAFIEGSERVWPVFPRALMLLLESTEVCLSGKRVALVVNSERFGKVLAAACIRYDMNPHIILEAHYVCQQAQILVSDIVITACGKPEMITSSFIKKDAIIIDGGISTKNNKTVGDANVKSVSEKAAYLSLVPGGVGPVTIACLLENVLTLCEK